MAGIELVFGSWGELAAACVVIGLAQAIYVLFGFGAGLIAVGALAAVMPSLQDVVVLLMLVSFPVELTVVIAARREVSWKGVGLICAGVAAGVPLGAWALRLGDPVIALGGLGLVLAAAGAAFLAVPQARAVRWPWWAAPPVGMVAGFLSGLFGAPGPPLVLYYQLGGAEKAAFRTQMMAVFLALAAVRIPTYAVSGLITEPRLWSGLAVMPAAILGAVVGHRIHVHVAESTYRRLVSAFLVAVGAVLVLRCFSHAW
jgi:hypothetical protein